MRSRQRLPYLLSSVFILKPRFLYGVAHHPRVIYMTENSNFENAVQRASSETRRQIGGAEGKVKWVNWCEPKFTSCLIKLNLRLHRFCPCYPALAPKSLPGPPSLVQQSGDIYCYALPAKTGKTHARFSHTGQLYGLQSMDKDKIRSKTEVFEKDDVTELDSFGCQTLKRGLAWTEKRK